MEKVRRIDPGTVGKWDKVPLYLRAISGFNSCVTVATVSAIFIWSINEAAIAGVQSWMTVTELQMFIMMMGPIIMAWNFVNAKSIITTILTPEGTNGETSEVKRVVVPSNTAVFTEGDIAIEREMFGGPATILRAIAGFISTHVICFCSLLFTWTIHDAMIAGFPLPSTIKLLLVVIGPIITSWNFVKASNTLSAVMAGTSALEKFRTRAANILMPKQ